MTEDSSNPRTIAWFSRGAASAVMTKQAIETMDNVEVVCIALTTEHSDSKRFADECEEWFGQPIEYIKSDEYEDTWDVWRKRRFIAGPQGAPCTGLLKKAVRYKFARRDDINLMGYTAGESHRLERIRDNEPGVDFEAPLIDAGIDKARCLELVQEAGIEIPTLYKLGYQNNNCFAAETEFITDLGVRTLGETVGQSVKVRGKGGGWKDAEVKSFGVQELFKVTVKRGSDKRQIFATSGHRWFTKASPHSKQVETTTSELKSGDRLPSVFGRLGNRVEPSPFGIAQGIVFGDGTRGNTLNTAATLVLCGEKNEELLKYFPLSPRATITTGIEVRNLPRHWKEPPALSNEAQGFLYGWLAGYFAADGCFSNGSAVLSSASKENLEVARDVAVRLGIGTNNIRVTERKGFGEEKTPLYTLPLISATLRGDFFLISEHFRRFSESNPREPHPWFVESVEPTDRVEEVFCAVVPDGEAFVLAENILTGNCLGCPKGGMGYWNAIRVDFPEVFQEMAELERELGHSILRDRRGGKKTPLFLDELDPERGNFSRDLPKNCSLFCPTEELGGNGEGHDDPEESK